ncbi:MAG: bifunctional hydroxymethylpyrimidine kinase/phosphomethylpyrimidine kinase [Ottowia sp.]|nr:bifunctional hydroxymethylpyrimidine kinase/phosphomethylpyrimidine kinase [Ottowia sp.]
MRPISPVRVLSIAGSDSGAGAGIQADIRTIAALGGHGLTAITAITAQNTLGVQACSPVDPALLRAQIASVVEDIGVDAVKIGMLASADSAMVVAHAIQHYQLKNSVLDPVMHASTGPALTTIAAQNVLRDYLFPLVSLVTPNLSECSAYLGYAVTQRSHMPGAAQAFLDLGCKAVLLKGGHLRDGLLADYYLDAQGCEYWFEHARIESRNLHGTGCTLATAIATELGRGCDMLEAIARAIDFVQSAIQCAQYELLGQGSGPIRQCSRMIACADVA